jgi:predicted GNAT family acetyltransferase
VSVDVRDEPDRNRFVAVVEGKESVLLYAPAGEGAVDFRSTFVDPVVRGRGIGEALVRAGVDWARAQGLSVVPTCWFVGVWMEREAAREARRGTHRDDAPDSKEGR